jgi:GAF domain-containing protein
MATTPDTDLLAGEKRAGLLFHTDASVSSDRFWKELAQLSITISRTTSVSICVYENAALRVEATAGTILSMERIGLWEALVKHEQYTEVEDTLKDVVFKFDSRVLDQPVIRFLGGMPIINSQGNRIGIIALSDSKPRKFSGEQIQSLSIISRVIAVHLDMKNRIPAA